MRSTRLEHALYDNYHHGMWFTTAGILGLLIYALAGTLLRWSHLFHPQYRFLQATSDPVLGTGVMVIGTGVCATMLALDCYTILTSRDEVLLVGTILLSAVAIGFAVTAMAYELPVVIHSIHL